MATRKGGINSTLRFSLEKVIWLSGACDVLLASLRLGWFVNIKLIRDKLFAQM